MIINKMSQKLATILFVAFLSYFAPQYWVYAESENSSQGNTLMPADEQTKTTNPDTSPNETKQEMNTQNTQQSTNAESENTSAEQNTYPGVVNGHIQEGGSGKPSISIYYPIFKNATIDNDLRKYVEDLVEDYKTDINVSTPDDEEEKPSSYDMWELTSFFTLEKPNPAIASVTFNTYTFTGGAHGNIVIQTFNCDLQNGKLLKFDDLFGDPQKALEILSVLCAQKLRQELGEDTEEDMLQDGTTPDVSNFSNLSLTPKGLFVEFQPYQVGPWSIGQQHVEISLEELAPAAPKKTIWPDVDKQINSVTNSSNVQNSR